MMGTLSGGSILAFFAAAAVALTGCAENESTLFIRGCLVPAPDTCAADPTADGALLASGFLDVNVSANGSYSCPLLVGNQLVPMGDDITLRTETSRIFVYAFDVDVSNASDGASVGSFRAPANGMIDPIQGATPGYGAVGALLVDSTSIQSALGAAPMGAELVVSVVARGRTLGGTEIESGAWPFQVGVCAGCTCSGQSPSCQLPDDTAELDCLAGLDGHCRFIDSDCP